MPTVPDDPEQEWDDEDVDEGPDVGPLSVFINPPEVVGELYGPDGEILMYLLDRNVVPFGFRVPGENDDE